MKSVTLGGTGITVPQNAFGCLPIQRVTEAEAVHLLRKAYAGGMRFFDTAHVYSDSEKKMGAAFDGFQEIPRDQIYLATKTQAKTPEGLREDLETSLRDLRTDYIDLFQLHCVPKCFRPGDGTGVYEALLAAKESGKVRHIGVTAHLQEVAFECVESGLYETLQFPFSYISSDKDIELVRLCEEKNMGFIAMKSLAGGLITNSKAAMAFAAQFNNVLPIWGIQRENELDEFLAFFEEMPVMTDEIRALIEKDKKELAGDFCRGCGYCMPCPMGITINQCARMSQMVRRAPSNVWLNEHWQAEMEKTKDCIECYQCQSRCPYGLDTPKLLKKNYEDYQNILAGRTVI